MTSSKQDEQPTLFEPCTVDTEKILLYALGEFQSRGKVLANRPLPMDRLRGAFKRAVEKFQTNELTDEKIAETLQRLGAKVIKRPSFVAKHPYQITVNEKLSESAKIYFRESLNDT